MKHTIIFSLLLITLFSCKNHEAAKSETSAAVEQITEKEALDLLHKWTQAYLNGDAGVLDEVLDESWVYSGSADGSVSDKASTIEEFSNADYSFGDISYQNLAVRLYGDVAVVRGSETMEIVGSSGLDTTLLQLRFTDVYQKKDGQVRAIATHSSPISSE